MTYNSLITRSEAGALMPEDAAREVIQSATEQSFILQVARRLPDMPRQVRRLPVVSALPTAYFVGNKGDGGASGLKQTSDMAWDNVYLYAEELAVIFPVPENVINDADYDIWGSIQPYMVQAFGAAIDGAMLFGTNKPADWPTAIVTGAADAGHTLDLSVREAAGDDLYDVFMGDGGLYSLVEQDGYEANGVGASLSLRGKIRGVRSTDGVPIFVQDVSQRAGYAIGGVPAFFPKNGGWNATSALAITGDWSQLVYAFRSDISVRVFDTGVITDGSGNIVVNLLQEDMVALRATMRLGFALPNVVNPVAPSAGTRYPFSVLVP